MDDAELHTDMPGPTNDRARRNRWRNAVALGLVVALFGGWASGWAQSAGPTAQPAPITVPIYDPKDPNRVVAMLSGVPAQIKGVIQFGQRQPLASVQVVYYDPKGQTNLLILGTNCVYDTRNRTAQSPDTLRVLTGDGRLELEGDGFTWWQTNNDLVISNRVQTKVRRPIATAGATNPLAGQDLRIFADRFRFNYQTNRIVYDGNVRVEDVRLELRCGRLTILRSASGGIEELLAQEDVVIRDRLSGGQTTGREAHYRVEEQRETVELTGDPHYQEGVREASADKFVLDRVHDTLQAIGQARLVLPIGSSGTPNLLAFSGPGPLPLETGTNRLVEVTAARVTMRLSATNGPVRGVIAETNVVLLDRQQNSRATAQRVEYGEDGRLELTGDPVWSAGDRVIKGTAIRFEPARQLFSVPGDVFVRLPVRLLAGPLAALAGSAQRTNLLIGTNQVVEFRSRELTYRDTWLRFDGEVRAEALDGNQKLGELECAALGVQYSNRVQQVRATGRVRLSQVPVERADGGTTAKRVECETLTFGFDPAGQLERVEAEGDVEARATETWKGGKAPVVRRLQCQTLNAQLRGTSNIVDSATAERNVVLSQNDRVAQADRAVYRGTNNLLSLEGKPLVVLPEGRITDAETITWNRVTGKFRIVGPFKSHWKTLSLGTNATRLLGPP